MKEFQIKNRTITLLPCAGPCAARRSGQWLREPPPGNLLISRPCWFLCAPLRACATLCDLVPPCARLCHLVRSRAPLCALVPPCACLCPPGSGQNYHKNRNKIQGNILTQTVDIGSSMPKNRKFWPRTPKVAFFFKITIKSSENQPFGGPWPPMGRLEVLQNSQ